MGQGSIRPPAERVAERLGRYRLVGKLFDGALGDLWLGEVVEGDGAGDPVWIRRVLLGAAVDDDAARGLVEAAREARKVQGESLHPVRDVLRTESEIAIVSQAVEGETLRSIMWRAGIKRQPIPPTVALRIGLDLLDAVGRLRMVRPHGARDATGIGADNVLVAVTGETLLFEPVVSGFAVAHEPWAKDPKWACYRAPETLRETTTLDERTDLFSAAVLLWEMLRNRPLFGGARFEAVERSIIQGSIGRVDSLRPPGSEAISKALADVVGRALERDPIARPSTLAAFAQQVQKAAEAVAPRAAVAAFVERVASDSLKRQRALSGDEGFHEAETIELRVPLSPDDEDDGAAPGAGAAAEADDKGTGTDESAAVEAGVPNFGALFGAPRAAGRAAAGATAATPARAPEGDEPQPGEASGEGADDGAAPEPGAVAGDAPEAKGGVEARSGDSAAGDDDDDAVGVVEAGAEPPSVPPKKDAAKDDGDAVEAQDGADSPSAAVETSDEASDVGSYRPPVAGESGGKLWLALGALVAVALLVWLVGPWSGDGSDGVRTGQPATALESAPGASATTSSAPLSSATMSATADVEDAAAATDADGAADAAVDAEPAPEAGSPDTKSAKPAGKSKSGGGQGKPKGRYMPGSL